ncbi:MAG: hypothetical protein ACJAV6_000611 [Candidatus Paceibacteria bacterium]|jgi:hypothetical protein
MESEPVDLRNNFEQKELQKYEKFVEDMQAK